MQAEGSGRDGNAQTRYHLIEEGSIESENCPALQNGYRRRGGGIDSGAVGYRQLHRVGARLGVCVNDSCLKTWRGIIVESPCPAHTGRSPARGASSACHLPPQTWL